MGQALSTKYSSASDDLPHAYREDGGGGVLLEVCKAGKLTK